MNRATQLGGMGKGANAYAAVGFESGVLAADPHHLIVMLFDGAESSIRIARACMQSGDIPEKGRAISKAIDIINHGLLAALDRERGGQVAENLGMIYEYINQQLLSANLNNDVATLDHAEKLLTDISSAWRELEVTSRGV